MSFASPKIQNGFFMHEVLDALSSNQADTNQDGKTSSDEVGSFCFVQSGAQDRRTATVHSRSRQHQQGNPLPGVPHVNQVRPYSRT